MAHHRKNLNTQLTQHSSQNDALLTAQNSSTTGITALNTKLDLFSGHTNNTITIGDGSTQLRTVPLGYDRTNGKAVSFLVDSAGHQQIDAVDVTAKLDTFAGAGNNNIGEGSSKLQIYNYGRDVSAGNFKPMVVNSSAEQIVALSSVDNSVLDTIATNTANIKISTDSVNLNVDTLEALQTSTNTKLDTIETSADALISANHTDLVAIEASLTSVEGKQDAQTTHLSNISSHTGTVDGCVASNKMNVNISSGNISGFATSTLQGTTHTKLDTLETTLTEIATDGDNIQTKLDHLSDNLDTLETTLTEIATDGDNVQTLLTTLDGVQDNVLTKLGEIETTNNACQVLLGTIDADTNDIKTSVQALDNAVDGNYLNVNQNVAGSDVAVNSGNKGATVPRVCIATDDIPIALVNTKLDHLSDNLDTLETTLTEIATDGDNVQTLLTTLDGVQDNVLTKLGEIETTNNANQVLLGTIDADTNDIKTAVEILDDIVLTEDTAHSSGHKGVMSLVVRQDSQADFGADGDYVPMSVNADGELRVTTGGGSVSKTVLNRTTARDLATNGSHSDYQIDTGTEANFISFYINFIDASFSENDLQVEYSQASDYSNPVVVFQGSTQTIIEYLDGSSTYNRAHIELKNPSRYVRLKNNDAASVLPINNSIIIHGRE